MEVFAHGDGDTNAWTYLMLRLTVNGGHARRGFGGRTTPKPGPGIDVNGGGIGSSNSLIGRSEHGAGSSYAGTRVGHERDGDRRMCLYLGIR